MRGDNGNIVDCSRVGCGPPPRARGQHFNLATGLRSFRSTPACAGTTFLPLGIFLLFTVHPRVRGDNYGFSHHRAFGAAVHPRVRGDNGAGRELGQVCAGPPPACAGTTSATVNSLIPAPVHPRVRGDNRIFASPSFWGCGPPPRAREQQAVRPAVFVTWRSTPACAGTTPLELSILLLPRSTPACAGTTSQSGP